MSSIRWQLEIDPCASPIEGSVLDAGGSEIAFSSWIELLAALDLLFKQAAGARGAAGQVSSAWDNSLRPDTSSLR